MKNKTSSLKKLAALALAGTMVFSTVGVSAFAAETTVHAPASSASSLDDFYGTIHFTSNGKDISFVVGCQGILGGLLYAENSVFLPAETVEQASSLKAGDTFTMTSGGKTYKLTVAEGRGRVWFRLQNKSGSVSTVYANWVEE